MLKCCGGGCVNCLLNIPEGTSSMSMTPEMDRKNPLKQLDNSARVKELEIEIVCLKETVKKFRSLSDGSLVAIGVMQNTINRLNEELKAEQAKRQEVEEKTREKIFKAIEFGQQLILFHDSRVSSDDWYQMVNDYADKIMKGEGNV